MKTTTKLFTTYLRRTILIAVLGIFLISMATRVFMLQNQAQSTAQERFDQISKILAENETELKAVQEDLNQKYIRNAEIIAYMVQRHPELPDNVQRMKEIAALVGVEEVCVFDETGTIYAGTHPEYNGMSFDSGEQMAFFKPMLTDHSLKLVQEPTPNTYDGALMQYAAVWSEDGAFILQVGKNPEVAMRITEQYKLSQILPLLRISSSAQLYAIDPDTGEITGSTLAEATGKNLSELGVELAQVQGGKTAFYTTFNGEKSYCVFDMRDGILLGRVVTNSSLYGELPLFAFVLVLVLLILAFILTYAVKNRVNELVVQNLEEANRKLHLITAGELEERLDLRGSSEFADLSDCVNALVESLSDKLNDEYQYQAELTEAIKLADAANKAKSSFLFSMSHDIRTPLNAIIGFCVMAEKHIDDQERVRDCLSKINSAGGHLLFLVNDVLDMARIESGRTDLNPQAHSVTASMENVRALLSADMENMGLDFTLECRVQDDIAVFDATRMEQISMNLLSNAMKFTPAGGSVRYTLTQIGRTEDGCATYQGVVTDTGIGMTPEFCRRAFDAFEQANTSTVSGVSGTGLGLTVTKALVDKMGGSISCTSELGVGTTVTYTVSFRIGDPGEIEQEPGCEAAEAADEQPVERKRILLVEDNELNREIAYEILADSGYLVECAEDGQIAVDKMSQSEPGYYDLILMDIQMPNMNGYEATEAIRKLEDPALANIPIVAFTANAFAEDQNKAYSVGMNGHLAKPIDVPKLLETLSYFL